MNPTELENQLWPHAQAAAGNMRFSPECEQDLRNLIQRSAAAVTPETLNDAAQNLRKIVAEMRSRAEAGLLQEWTLCEALLSLCPIFPFC